MTPNEPRDLESHDGTETKTNSDSNPRLFENATPADDSNVRHVAASPDTIDSHPAWDHFEAMGDGDPELF
jgi:hypothetical protein